MDNTRLERDIEAYAASPITLFSGPSSAVFMMRSRFSPFEGEIQPSHHIKIGMNIGTTSQLYHRDEHHVLEAPWRRNGITVNLPGMKAVSKSAAVTMLGIAIDPGFMKKENGLSIDPSVLEELASRITMDAVAARHFRSLVACAEFHGCSTAFFEQELSAFLHRLSDSAGRIAVGGISPLDTRRLAQVQAFIRSGLSEDITVAQMAKAVTMDTTHFAKAFRGATGLTPYAYLTHARMDHAKTLLQMQTSVTEVALTVNYANPSKFAAAFRRCTGYTPTDWQKHHPV